MNKISITVITLFTCAQAMADSVIDMCRDTKKQEIVCRCAADNLKSAIGQKDYELYEAIGAMYDNNKKSGMPAGDAWDAAVRENAGTTGFSHTLTTTNKIGMAHRKAMKDCAK